MPRRKKKPPLRALAESATAARETSRENDAWDGVVRGRVGLVYTDTRDGLRHRITAHSAQVAAYLLFTGERVANPENVNPKVDPPTESRDDG